tara:strand:+ start:261 stop:488 length:228 start_codon:yes stop_codon:yes gene_type:complete
MKMKTKIIGTVTLGAFLWYSYTLNSKYNDISNKLDTIISVSNKGKIDSLQYELMILGSKLDSMVLKYDYNFNVTK